VTAGDHRPQAPWSTGALARLVAGVVAGGVLGVLAGDGAATEGRLDDQKGFIATGVAGFLVAVLAQSLWLHQGRKAVAVYAAAVQTSVASLVDEAAAAPSVMTSGSDGLVATSGIRHFHRPDCPIAAGRGWSTESRRSHEAAGRTPCGICTP
jgi:hypothetical protein